MTQFVLDTRLDADRTGFALVGSIFVLVILGALVAGGYFVSAQQARTAAAGPQASSAFYAAEAGLSAGVVQLQSFAIDALLPGQTELLTYGRLVPGDEYSVDITRLSPGGDGGKGYYLVRSTGRAHGPRGGRRQVAWLLRVQPQPEPEVPTPQGPKLYSPQPLAEFAWFEILE